MHYQDISSPLTVDKNHDCYQKMAVTVDSKPISTIVLYVLMFVIVLFKAMESELELLRLIRMVADFIDIKICVNFLIMTLIVNHGTTTIEKILNWRSVCKRIRGNEIRGGYYKSYTSCLAIFDCRISKIFKLVAIHAAKNQIAVKLMSEECKALTWTDKSSHPDTAKGVVDENNIHLSKDKDICSGNETAKAEDQDHYSKDNSKPDEIIIIPDSNYNKSVDMNHEQREHEIRRVNKTKRICSRRKRISCEENKPQSTKAQGSVNFELAFTTGVLMAVKPSKKALLLVVLIVSGLSPTATAPIQQDPERRGLYEYKLLLTSNCNYRDIINSSTCQTTEELSNTYIGYCRFTDLCDPGFKPICVNGDGGGMLHICSPRGLTCQKGYRRRAWLNGTDPDVVLVQEEKCQQGRFQSDKSNCYDACLARHEDIIYLPEEFAIYSMGDNISPTWIYCDFEKGFYNMDGKFLLAYDDQFMFHSYFCTDVNTCASGKYPLPNGTCVLPCNDGLKRDAHDSFQCKVQSLVGKSSGKENIIDKVDIHPNKEQDQTTVMRKAENNGPIEFELTTQNARFRTTIADDNDSAAFSTALIAGLTGAFVSLLFVVVIVVLIWACLTKRKAKSIRINTENRTENKTVIDKVENVHITNHVNTGTDNTHIAPAESCPFLANGIQN